MQIIEVGESRKLQKEFLEFPSRIYKGNKYWIRPLDEDIEKIFDPKKNPLFDGGDCVRWLALDVLIVRLLRLRCSINARHGYRSEAWKQWKAQ
jgi:hypothetical protein